MNDLAPLRRAGAGNALPERRRFSVRVYCRFGPLYARLVAWSNPARLRSGAPGRETDFSAVAPARPPRAQSRGARGKGRHPPSTNVRAAPTRQHPHPELPSTSGTGTSRFLYCECKPNIMIPNLATLLQPLLLRYIAPGVSAKPRRRRSGTNRGVTAYSPVPRARLRLLARPGGR